MNNLLIFDNTYKGQDYSSNNIPKASYENCIFDNCNFANANLTNTTFSECEFIDCDLSNANVTQTVFKETFFKSSKLLGVKFHSCNTFLLSFTFEHCTLDYASFYKLKMKNTLFNHCNMVEVDFSEANLNTSIFYECDLRNATFNNTELEKVDLITAINFSIDPSINNIKNAKFSKENIVGLLTKYKIEIND